MPPFMFAITIFVSSKLWSSVIPCILNAVLTPFVHCDVLYLVDAYARLENTMIENIIGFA